ncbi:leucinerich repeat kinase [Pelomyxa schiedti]|nr:leucinerich repeat kinase [Pelomyxa schiedti]
MERRVEGLVMGQKGAPNAHRPVSMITTTPLVFTSTGIIATASTTTTTTSTTNSSSTTNTSSTDTKSSPPSPLVQPVSSPSPSTPLVPPVSSPSPPISLHTPSPTTPRRGWRNEAFATLRSRSKKDVVNSPTSATTVNPSLVNSGISGEVVSMKMVVTGPVDCFAKVFASHFTAGVFLPSHDHDYAPTTKTVTINNKSVLVTVAHQPSGTISDLTSSSPTTSDANIVIYVQSLVDHSGFAKLEEYMMTIHKFCKGKLVLCLIDHTTALLSDIETDSPPESRGIPGSEVFGLLSKFKDKDACWMVRNVDASNKSCVKAFFEEIVARRLTKRKGKTWRDTLPDAPEYLPFDQIEKFCTNIRRNQDEEQLDKLLHCILESPNITLADMLLCGNSGKKKLLFIHDDKCFTSLMAHFPKQQASWLDQVHPLYRLMFDEILKSLPPKISERSVPDFPLTSTTLAVSLQNLFLVTIPAQVEKSLGILSSSLTCLNISHNSLTQLPPVITQLKNLSILNIAWNLLTSLPEWISNCIKLQELNIEHNDLTELPEGIGDCLQMTLRCGYNSLVTLPHSLVQHIKTKRITFLPNPLTGIPCNATNTPDVLLYLDMCAKSGFTRWPRVKVVLVGPENVGKTTLLHRFQGRTHDGMSTDGIDIQEFQLRNIDFTVWDFGGQAVFLPTHQFFLTGRALYLVLFDLHNPNSQRTEYWLRQIMRTVRSAPFPPIILVGTRADKLPNAEKGREICAAMCAQFRSICLIAAAVPIAAKDGDLNELEESIVQIAMQKQSLLRTRVPGNYILLDEIITENRKTMQIVHWDEFQKWGRTVNIEDDKIKEVALFLHGVGSILYYEAAHSQLGDYVVLHPKFLADVMSTTITFKTNMINNGFISKEALLQLWHMYDLKSHSMIAELLSLFLILHPITINRKDGYLVPCALPEKAPPDSENPDPPETREYRTQERVFSFPCLPIGLFGRVLVRIMHIPNIVKYTFWKDNLKMEVLPEADARTQFASVVFDSSSGLTPFLTISVRAPANSNQFLLLKIIEAVDSTIDCFYKGLSLDIKQYVTCPHCVDPSGSPSAPLPHRFRLDEIFSALKQRNTLFCEVEKINVRPHALVPDLMFQHFSQIQESELSGLVQIGQGGFGKIYKATWDGKEVAVKELFVSTDSEEALEKLMDFKREVSLMSTLNSPFVVKLFGISNPEDRPPMMVMEFVPQGDLMKILHKTCPSSAVPTGALLQAYPIEDANYYYKINWYLRILIALDVAQGLMYLHTLHPPIIHRDLRSPNIFIASLDPAAPVRAKVADFGLSITVAGKVCGNLSTWQWLAPEVISSNSDTYDEQSDIFSLGIVIYELITRKFPYDEYAEMEKYSLRRGSNLEWRSQSIKNDIVQEGLRPTVPLYCPLELKQFVESCLVRNPSARPNAKSSVSILKSILGIATQSVVTPPRELPPLPEEIPPLWQFCPDLGFKIYCADADPKACSVFAACSDGVVRQISPNLGSFVGTPMPISRPSRIYSLLLVNGELWVGTAYGRIVVFDPLTSTVKCEVPAHGEAHYIAKLINIVDCTNVTKSIWSVSATEETVVTINPQTKEVCNKVYVGDKLQMGCICQYKSAVWLGCYGKIIVIDSSSMETRRVITRGIPAHRHSCAIVCEDSAWFGLQNLIRIYNCEYMNCTQTLIGHNGEVCSLCMALGYIWSSDSEGLIIGWNPHTLTPVKKIPLSGLYINTVISVSNILLYTTMFPEIKVGAYNLCGKPEVEENP